MDQIVSLMKNAEKVDIVERDLTAFRVTSEELKKSVAALFNDLETDEELKVANDWYAEQLSRMSNFVETTEQWISSAKNKIEENLESRSLASKLTGSSRRSKGSSSKFSVASGREKEKAKAAEIRAKVALLERKQELEKRKERLHLDEELAVAEARQKAYAEIEEGAMREKASIHGSLTAVHPQAPQPQPYLRFNPFAPEFRVARDSDKNASSGFPEILNQQNKMTEMLVQQYQQGLLPSLRITRFTGDLLEYSTFIRSFESQIESKVKLSDVCLRYLEQYLEGEPRELIKGCLHLDELNDYLEAKKLLSEKYGDPYKLSNAYIKKINEWP